MEKVQYSPLAPWLKPPRCRVVVAESKDESVVAHDAEVARLEAAGGLVAYSDGSLIDGRAGAAAVVRLSSVRSGEWGENGRGMGQHQSIYAAELEGARLALHAVTGILAQGAIDTGQGLRDIDPRPPGKSFVRHLHSLPRPHAVLLSGLRLDFNDLGASKRRMGRSDGLCECGEVETREHFVAACERFSDSRASLRRKVGGLAPKMVDLFAPRNTRALIKFVQDTGRIPRMFYAL